MYTQVFQVPTFVLIYFAPTLYVAFWTTFFRGLYILCLHWKRTAEPLIKTTYSFSRWCFRCWWLLFCLGYRRLFFNGWVVFFELILSVPRAKNHTLDPNWALWLVWARGTFQFLVSISQDPRRLSQAATIPSRCWYTQEHPCEYRKGERCHFCVCLFTTSLSRLGSWNDGLLESTRDVYRSRGSRYHCNRGSGIYCSQFVRVYAQI